MKCPCFRGELYYAFLGYGKGSEQQGIRPVVILQNDVGNKYGSTTIIAPISRKRRGNTKLPTHCTIGPMEGVIDRSVVLLEQIRTIDKDRLGRRLGKLPKEKIREIDRAINISLGLTTVNS